MVRRVLILVLAALAAASAPRRVHEEPIIRQGDKIPAADGAVISATGNTAAEQAGTAARRDSLAAVALAECAPALCEALARGEVALGMTEAQVLAATRTTDEAWTIRRAGAATVLVPRSLVDPPRDAAGDLAMVQLRNGRVGAYSYREAQGVRVVNEAADATTAGRATQLAEMLLREGDDLAARGELNAALDRYDRAQVLRANDPQIDYRIATVLDKQLRPIEALVRYQLFLHRLEIEKIQAVGEAYAKLAEAIAYAKERVIVLERRTR
ncbi:MAG: hypothetical protein HY561_09280 [Gemmatimonadetes bacterium]|nr:hypothetical protein [Gemmatimonadota bacterium]